MDWRWWWILCNLKQALIVYGVKCVKCILFVLLTAVGKNQSSHIRWRKLEIKKGFLLLQIHWLFWHSFFLTIPDGYRHLVCQNNTYRLSTVCQNYTYGQSSICQNDTYQLTSLGLLNNIYWLSTLGLPNKIYCLSSHGLSNYSYWLSSLKKTKKKKIKIKFYLTWFVKIYFSATLIWFAEIYPMVYPYLVCQTQSIRYSHLLC